MENNQNLEEKIVKVKFDFIPEDLEYFNLDYLTDNKEVIKNIEFKRKLTHNNDSRLNFGEIFKNNYSGRNNNKRENMEDNQTEIHGNGGGQGEGAVRKKLKGLRIPSEEIIIGTNYNEPEKDDKRIIINNELPMIKSRINFNKFYYLINNNGNNNNNDNNTGSNNNNVNTATTSPNPNNNIKNEFLFLTKSSEGGNIKPSQQHFNSPSSFNTNKNINLNGSQSSSSSSQSSASQNYYYNKNKGLEEENEIEERNKLRLQQQKYSPAFKRRTLNCYNYNSNNSNSSSNNSSCSKDSNYGSAGSPGSVSSCSSQIDSSSSTISSSSHSQIESPLEAIHSIEMQMAYINNIICDNNNNNNNGNKFIYNNNSSSNNNTSIINREVNINKEKRNYDCDNNNVGNKGVLIQQDKIKNNNQSFNHSVSNNNNNNNFLPKITNNNINNTKNNDNFINKSTKVVNSNLINNVNNNNNSNNSSNKTITIKSLTEKWENMINQSNNSAEESSKNCFNKGKLNRTNSVFSIFNNTNNSNISSSNTNLTHISNSNSTAASNNSINKFNTNSNINNSPSSPSSSNSSSTTNINYTPSKLQSLKNSKSNNLSRSVNDLRKNFEVLTTFSAAPTIILDSPKENSPPPPPVMRPPSPPPPPPPPIISSAEIKQKVNNRNGREEIIEGKGSLNLMPSPSPLQDRLEDCVDSNSNLSTASIDVDDKSFEEKEKDKFYSSKIELNQSVNCIIGEEEKNNSSSSNISVENDKMLESSMNMSNMSSMSSPENNLSSLIINSSNISNSIHSPPHIHHYHNNSSSNSSSKDNKEQYGSITSLASSTSLISPQELQQLIDEANQSLIIDGNYNYSNGKGDGSGEIINNLSELSVIILHREYPKGSLGITLAGGIDYENKDITVHKVISNSIAENDGRIKKGDRVLSINGKCTKDLTHREVLNLLKSPRLEVVLVIQRNNNQNNNSFNSHSLLNNDILSTSSTYAIHEERNEDIKWGPVKTIVIIKKDNISSGLGFSLEGGKCSIDNKNDRPLIIKKIFIGGPADSYNQQQTNIDLKISIGDLLESIQNVSMESRSRTEAWNFMKKLPEGENCTVKLNIRSPL